MTALVSLRGEERKEEFPVINTKKKGLYRKGYTYRGKIREGRIYFK